MCWEDAASLASAQRTFAYVSVTVFIKRFITVKAVTNAFKTQSLMVMDAGIFQKKKKQRECFS